MAKNYVVKVNSVEKIEQLLQEIYDQALKLFNDIQNEHNKLTNSTNLSELTLDEKAKYAKAVNDFLTNKNKAIQMKFDIAKFMGEMVKHGGDVDKTLNDPSVSKNSKLDINSLRQQINEIIVDEPETYNLKGGK